MLKAKQRPIFFFDPAERKHNTLPSAKDFAIPIYISAHFYNRNFESTVEGGTFPATSGQLNGVPFLPT
jgi:hypothetical protein